MGSVTLRFFALLSDCLAIPSYHGSLAAHPRNPAQSMNLTDKVQLVALPPERYKNLPAHGGKSSYLHEVGPIRRMPGQIF